MTDRTQMLRNVTYSSFVTASVRAMSAAIGPALFSQSLEQALPQLLIMLPRRSPIELRPKIRDFDPISVRKDHR